MKTLRIFSFLAILMAMVQFSFAQSKTEKIPVSGNCGMCKSNIEKAAKKAGASSASWDMEAKVLTISYNSSSTDAAKIQQNVAAVGYDTRDFKASDAAYDKLHACCKYDRVGSKEEACCDSQKCGKEENCCASMDCCKDGKCKMGKKVEKGEGHQHKSAGMTGESCCNGAACTKKA
jgi:periplasmic mercuric ion binding protein